MATDPVLHVAPLGFPWETIDPFLFCVYHDDAYPPGNARFGPDASLAGRELGQDFAGKDGWRMYHGLEVPGFPSHPHRGFETVTIVRKGLIDHSDSLGAAARFGGGDVQWLTAGRGIVHAEMFPLLDAERPNPLELFQIWLNLPARSKFVPPHFTMFWSEDIPQHVGGGEAATRVVCIAGRYSPSRLSSEAVSEAASEATSGVAGKVTLVPLAPPPDSYASSADSDLAIWTIRMDPGARFTLPAAASAQTRRKLYFFKGARVSIGDRSVDVATAIELRPDVAAELVNGPQPSEFLMLQGKPIGEQVAQYGPFVMNTEQELQQAFADYRRTGFGGWPWPDTAPVHGPARERFARHGDGQVENRSAAVGAEPAA